MLTQRRSAFAALSEDGNPLLGGQSAAVPPEVVLDAAALAGLRALDPTGQNRLMQRVFTAFRASTDRLMPQLLESQRNADPSGIRYVAHTLKSSAASVGGLAVSRICADLETRIRLEQTHDLQPQVLALQEAVEGLLLALQRFSEPPP